MCNPLFPNPLPSWAALFRKIPYPVPNSLGVKPGHPFLLLPSHPPRQKQKEKGVETKERAKERVTVCVISYLYPATCSLKGYGSGGAAAEATAVGFFSIHTLSQTGLACPSRAPLSPSPPPICGAGWDLFGASRGPRPFTDNPPHAKLPAVHNTDRILDSIILLIQISYLPVCAIHEFSLQ